MYKYLKKILSVLSPRQKFIFYIVNFLLLVASILETLSIIALLPIARIITGGNQIYEQYPILSFLKEFEFINLLNVEKLLVFFMFIVLIIFIVKNLVLVFIYYLKEKYFFNVRVYIMNSIYLKYIHQTYTSRSKKNSSLFINNIINESSLLVDMGIKNYVNLFQESAVIIMMTIFLLILNPLITFGSIIFLLLLFIIIYLPSKKIIKKFSLLRQINEEKRMKDLNETFENFKYIKILSLENFLSKVFANQNIAINKALYIVSFIAMLPIKFFETSLIIGLFLICFILSGNGYTIGDLTTILLAFSLCGLRMLPSLNRIFLYLQSIKFSYPAVDKVYEDLTSKIEYNPENIEKIKDIKNIQVKITKFGYFENETLFKNIDMLFEKGDKIFLKGRTGSGKSSLINLITGLIIDENVQILINQDIKKNINEKIYQKINFGYVPQDVFLSNTTFKDNINLNNTHEIENFKKIISICRLKEFVDSLPLKENTIINERSANISGGQKQRIAIARALMSDAQILILDEATNALDNVTEKKVFEDIIKNFPAMIIIIISHNDNLEKYCNKIYEIKNKDLNLTLKSK